MDGFGVGETHGILLREENETLASSGPLGWRSVFTSVQREQPFEDAYKALPDHLIILHLDGYVRVDRWLGISRESRMIAPGGVFMVPGGVDFRVRLNDPLTTAHFYIRHAVLAEVAQDLYKGDPDRLELLPRIGDVDPLIERLILSLRDEIQAPSAFGETLVDYTARLIGARLIRNHSANEAKVRLEVAAPSDLQRKIARVTEFVQSNLHRSIQLEDMAAVLDLSVSQLSALFRKGLGQPPHRFLLNLRVARARELLATGDLPIVEIALACGFSHQEHMTRMFRREIGVTPGAYRRSIG
ncbi:MULTISPECIES: AraC family transcriptional regulator [Inquilinus]|uniref:AraC family transcriptional regulator n=1 Tax=Inquilinus ginsengisoli TaxID=363840 RepID=A0ABU1K0T9_9PROT|nr:AraC family transcriptional regulator [Inquilinus ginsengisoli]MDR6294483.1 AraC family transcriptional regulator [Inquilinus ginsengisoli]